jgi:hypothetical protein
MVSDIICCNSLFVLFESVSSNSKVASEFSRPTAIVDLTTPSKFSSALVTVLTQCYKHLEWLVELTFHAENFCFTYITGHACDFDFDRVFNHCL